MQEILIEQKKKKKKTKKSEKLKLLGEEKNISRVSSPVLYTWRIWLRNFWDYFSVLNIFFSCSVTLIFLFFRTKWCHSKQDFIKTLFLLLSIFSLWHVMILIYEKHLNEAEQITKLAFYFHPQNTEKFVSSTSRTIRNDCLKLRLQY